MENTMGPPLPPGYSLRVMLFGGHAHHEGDRPLRCFRVVSSPDITVQDFCREASRIHEINYGGAIDIKKVQDDQEFDITQIELLGNVFRNLDTIRIIQAASHPGMRDSLPPTSALRFTSGASKKRIREESVQLDDPAPFPSFNSSKKQRLSNIDPDHPLPSREIVTNGRKLSVIHDSQDSDDVGAIDGAYNNTRHVRHPLPRIIPGTPSPPPTSPRKSTSKNGSADYRGAQSDNQSPIGDFSLLARTDQSTPFQNERARSHASNPPRAKSASYHISRPDGRGASLSTVATSPLSAERQGLPQNNTVNATQQNQGEPIIPASNGVVTRSQKEHNIADDVTSDDEGPAVSKTKTAVLNRKSNNGNGLSGLNWARKFSTPPSATQQRPGPGSRWSATTSGELPLTPTSKQRQEKELKNDENARDTRMAALEAAEKRKLEADEARQVEEARIATEEQEKQEELERVIAERQAEAESIAAIVKSARLRKVEEAREKKEAKQLRDFDKGREMIAAEAGRVKKIQEDASKAQLPSSSPAQARTPISTPILLPRRASGSRGQSGTPLIPPRKSALKNIVSSSALISSSPSGPIKSPDRNLNGVGIETQMPLPKSNRRVSFKQDEHKESPVPLPTKRILPPAKTYTSTPPGINPKDSVEKPVAKTPTLAAANLQSSVISCVPPPKRYSLGRTNTSMIVSQATSGAKTKLSNVVAPKATLAKATHATVSPISKSASPTAQVTPVPLPVSRIRKGETLVRPPLPPASSQHKNNETPVRPSLPPASSQSKKETPIRPPSKDRSKSMSVEPGRPSAQGHESKKEDVEVSTSTEPKVGQISTASGRLEVEDSGSEISSDDEVAVKKMSVDEDAEKMIVDEDATQSHHTSSCSQSRSCSESRSPISFFREASEEKHEKLESPIPDASEDEDENEDEEMMDVADEDVEAVSGITSSPTIKRSQLYQISLSSSESEDEEVKARVPESSPPMRAVGTPETKPINAKLKNSKESSRTERSSTQDQVDHQLTSSMYEVRSSPPESNTPTLRSTSNTNVRPPAIKFGASLNELHQRRSSLGTSSQIKPPVGRNGQFGAKLLQTGDDDQSESSDDASNAESSSDGDDDIPAKAPAATQSVVPGSWTASLTGTSTKERSKNEIPKYEIDLDNVSSDSDDSEDDDSEKQRKKAGKELAAHVAAMQSSHSSKGIMPSPKKFPFETLQQRTPKAKATKTYGKRENSKQDKYTHGYTFSQVR